MLSIDNIPGLEPLKMRLKNMAAKNQVPNTLLFSGADGSAALPIALALAQLMVCDYKTDGLVCQKCAQCIQFHQCSYPDLHITYPIDGAGSEGAASGSYGKLFVDAISENPYLTKAGWLKEMQATNKQGIIPTKETTEILRKLSFTNFGKTPRFMIIWQADLLHPTAANKLLKALEEPSYNTYFFLITAKKDALLKTVLSRCVLVQVGANTQNDVAEYLENNNFIDAEHYHPVMANTTIGEAIDQLQEGEAVEDAKEMFVSWMRILYSAKPEDMVRWSEETSTLYRDVLKRFLELTAALLQQAFTLTLVPNQPSFKHGTFDLRKFAPFINTTKMNEILALIDSCKADIERNANPKLALLDTTLQLSKYIGKA